MLRWNVRILSESKSHTEEVHINLQKFPFFHEYLWETKAWIFSPTCLKQSLSLENDFIKASKHWGATELRQLPQFLSIRGFKLRNHEAGTSNCVCRSFSALEGGRSRTQRWLRNLPLDSAAEGFAPAVFLRALKVQTRELSQRSWVCWRRPSSSAALV